MDDETRAAIARQAKILVAVEYATLWEVANLNARLDLLIRHLGIDRDAMDRRTAKWFRETVRVNLSATYEQMVETRERAMRDGPTYPPPLDEIPIRKPGRQPRSGQRAPAAGTPAASGGPAGSAAAPRRPHRTQP